jgi:pimeloyl-ACP methyl ester carboxylesterase
MDWTSLSERFAPQTVDTALGRTAFRRAGQGGPVLVLLHGIGSASGSWVAQLDALSATHTVLAWDAPGYGQSEPLPDSQPTAHAYAQRMWAWLDALGFHQPLTLVGHSLGALMATAAAGEQSERVRSLVLLSPAAGYGQAAPELRQAKRDDRLHKLASLGPAGMAEQRGAAMLSPQAPPEMVAYVKATMARIHPAGYTQATHMLANADLASLLVQVRCPVTVACGEADTITPPAGCRALAQQAGLPEASYVSLGPVGHACALEAAPAVNALLQAAV